MFFLLTLWFSDKRGRIDWREGKHLTCSFTSIHFESPARLRPSTKQNETQIHMSCFPKS